MQYVRIALHTPTPSPEPSPQPEPIIVPLDFGHAGLLRERRKLETRNLKLGAASCSSGLDFPFSSFSALKRRKPAILNRRGCYILI
jgi:hypothetical protein